MSHIFYLTTQDFMHDVAKREIKQLIKKEVQEITKGEFKLELKDKDLFEIFSKLYYFSKTLQHIYLGTPKEKKDLIGFSLTRRNHTKDEIKILLSSYLFSLMEIKEPFSCLDPLAGCGELVIEASLRNKPLHIKERSTLLFSKLFSKLTLPKNSKDKNSIRAIVNEDKEFKSLKEKISQEKTSFRISKYGLDMLDVKFKEAQFDYVICFLEDKKIEEELLYQAEFVSNKKIGIISSFSLSSKWLKKLNLSIIEKNFIKINKSKWFVTIYTKT